MTLFWIIVAIAVVGLAVWYLLVRKKGGPIVPRKPEGPPAPPPSAM